MLGGDAFVAEGATQLVDFIKTTYNQSLKMEFMGNAQVEILVECVVVGDKGVG
ncbi:hypothetical protein ES703_95635 [subsurface metagenome]